ncbi:glycosyltransferase family 1 protein [Diaporthe amygdali]|uniref:glycosyltransferase family 1 protein n=1 Tax=Phomopsis amygdali TaxID=1214568 RepID=UPI0022FDD777|nr:glycosyltransferase family 1 protein [Diaporthe amygdali]KAJ0120279.1 glycosyltransferase family 1 protein [Diaporthe amygdali]
MPKKGMGKKTKGVKKAPGLRKAKKAGEAAAAANTPTTTAAVDLRDDNPQHDTDQSDWSDGELIDAESISIGPNERERFKRVIRLSLYSNDESMGRRLLVTGGATVPFVPLLEEAINETFLQSLRAHGFTHVYLQCGTAHDQIETRLKTGRGGIQIETFDFCRDLKSLMKEHCRGEKGVKPAGVVIGHAGTGTISDATEVDCALVIVANTTLMDDHQSVFAAEMAAEYPTIIQAHLGRSVPEIMHVIKKNALDDLKPYEEPGLPREQQITFIDEVIAGATRPQSSRCVVQ